MKPIFIIGAGGLGREVKALISRLPEWQVAGFYDDAFSQGMSIAGVPCLGGIDRLMVQTDLMMEVVLAIGDPRVKLRLMQRLVDARHLHFPALVDPSAILLDRQQIKTGQGSILCAGATLTTCISIGRNCLINLNVTIGHDTQIGDGCSIMPGANLAGGVVLGRSILVGSGANILNGVVVGDFARIGAGAVVLQDVAANTTVTGVPAKAK